MRRLSGKAAKNAPTPHPNPKPPPAFTIPVSAALDQRPISHPACAYFHPGERQSSRLTHHCGLNPTEDSPCARLFADIQSAPAPTTDNLGERRAGSSASRQIFARWQMKIRCAAPSGFAFIAAAMLRRHYGSVYQSGSPLGGRR